ncbi:hypothetical protein [Streptomyces olivochromogenes]|nr:hypothetical protein [Streptomyces olivochromogenes]
MSGRGPVGGVPAPALADLGRRIDGDQDGAAEDVGLTRVPLDHER